MWYVDICFSSGDGGNDNCDERHQPWLLTLKNMKVKNNGKEKGVDKICCPKVLTKFNFGWHNYFDK